MNCAVSPAALASISLPPEDARSLRTEYECRAAQGFDVDFLTREDLAAISSIRAAAALRSRGDAQIDPYRFTHRLVTAAVRQGLQVYGHTDVTNIEERNHDVVVQTLTGTIVAKSIVYATGYDSQYLLEDWSGSLHSTYVLASEPNCDIPGWPDQCLIWETARPYFYARKPMTAAPHRRCRHQILR